MPKIKSVKTLKDIPVFSKYYVKKGTTANRKFGDETIRWVFDAIDVYEDKYANFIHSYDERLVEKYENDLFEIEYEKESIEDIEAGDYYYFINYIPKGGFILSEIFEDFWVNFSVDWQRYYAGNMYFTKEEAEADVGVNYKKIVEEIEKESKKDLEENITAKPGYRDDGIRAQSIKILDIIKEHKGKK